MPKGHKLSKEQKAYKSKIMKALPPNKGTFKKGIIPRYKGTKGVLKFPNRKSSPLSEQHRKNISEGNKGHAGYWKGKKGPESANWQGGIYPEHLRLRKSEEYRLWRVAVFERDSYTCVWCGIKGSILNADHIKPFCDYPELRFAIDNGRTLCAPCHRTTDTYGGRKKKE